MIESDLFYEQSPHGIHDGHDKDACIGKNGHPHIGQAQRPQDKDNHLDPDGKINILVDNGHSFFRDANGFPDFQRIIIHQNDIGSFDGCIGPHSPHGNPYIG